MIAALMIGRAGSTGYPGKNVSHVLGRALCEYPLIAASGSSYIDEIFISTDCEQIRKIGNGYSAIHIDRPAFLATSESFADDVFLHGYGVIKDFASSKGKTIEFLVLLFANAGTINTELIDQGVTMLRSDPDLDGAVTTSVYNMYSPIRARKLSSEGYLQPFIPLEAIGDPSTFNTSRDSHGNVHFTDGSVIVIRPRALENISEGLPPHRFMGKKIGSIPNWGGCDVDYEWQVPMVEFWLRAHGFSEKSN